MATTSQQWPSPYQPRKFLAQYDNASHDELRQIAVAFPPNYSAAKRALMDFATAELNRLLRLRPDWDALAAKRVAETASESAIHWLDLLADDETFLPQIFPLPNGGVQVEWLAAGESLEIEIGPQGEVGILGLDAAENVLVEGDYPDSHSSSALIMAARKHLNALSRAVRAASSTRT